MSGIEKVLATIEDATKIVEGMKTQHGKDIKQIDARIGELEQEFARAPANGLSSRNTLGNVVASALEESDGLANIRNGSSKHTGQINIAQPLKAAISNPDRGQTGDTSYPTPVQRDGSVKGIPGARLSILDLLPTVPVTSSTYEFVRLDGYVNGADYQVIEGDEKSKTDLPTKMERAEVATIAHWLPASLQVISDNAGLQSLIQQLLSIGCRQKLEHEVLVGVGGEGKIKGLVPQAMAFAANGNVADRIGAAIVDLNSAGWNANAVILHPTVWFDLTNERDTTRQYVMGSPRDPSPAALWNVPIITAPSMPVNQALILDTSVTALLDRQAVTVEASRQDGDNFRRNLVTILAELRAGLAVYATTGTRLLDLTGA